MLDWLKPLPMMFYAPARGMALARDRAPLGVAALLALLAQAAQMIHGLWPLMRERFGPFRLLSLFPVVLNAAGVLVLLSLVFVPLAILLANLFERRGSFGVVVRQEYAATASCVFYALAAVSVTGIAVTTLVRATGVAAAFAESFREAVRVTSERQQVPPEALSMLASENAIPIVLSFLIVLPLFFVWSWAAVRAALRLSWGRAFAVAFGCGAVTLFASQLMPIFSMLLGSPFLLLLAFLLGRGYLNDFMSVQRARASFRQNLEAATLNPADASAHYNLGLIHLSRKELDDARARFQRAVEIDAEEIDSHYQLGRISRMQQRLPEAIEHFGQVVTRDDAHAQHEVWREIGATYLDAGQFSDSLDALERFIDRRPSDPEALYLKGRALAGAGRGREAADAMRACIEAVQTAPAYKYKTDKRWLNEAQQFLRTQV